MHMYVIQPQFVKETTKKTGCNFEASFMPGDSLTPLGVTYDTNNLV